MTSLKDISNQYFLRSFSTHNDNVYYLPYIGPLISRIAFSSFVLATLACTGVRKNITCTISHRFLKLHDEFL